MIPPAAVHAAHVAPGDADHRRFHRHAHDRFRFFHRAANRAHREIEIDDLTFAPALRFRRAQRRELHAAVVIQLADQRAGFRAADIQRHDMPFFLGQIPAPFLRCYRLLRTSPLPQMLLRVRTCVARSFAPALATARSVAARVPPPGLADSRDCAPAAFPDSPPLRRRIANPPTPRGPVVARHCPMSSSSV